MIRWLTAAVVAVVVSFSHIYDLGRAHGQSGTAGRGAPSRRARTCAGARSLAP